jgi:hypothetical protein
MGQVSAEGITTCVNLLGGRRRRANAMVPIDAPNKVCGAYLARQGNWHLPVLTGIANALGGRRNDQLLLDVGHHRVRQARLAEFREVLDDDALP